MPLLNPSDLYSVPVRVSSSIKPAQLPYCTSPGFAQRIPVPLPGTGTLMVYPASHFFVPAIGPFPANIQTPCHPCREKARMQEDGGHSNNRSRRKGATLLRALLATFKWRLALAGACLVGESILHITQV